jgi:hypothetical protein
LKITVIDDVDPQFAAVFLSPRQNSLASTDTDGAALRTFLEYLLRAPVGEELRISRKGILVDVRLGSETAGYVATADSSFSVAAFAVMKKKAER